MEDKETVWAKLLKLTPWIIAVFLLIYFGRVIRPVLRWLGLWIDAKTRSQAMTAADLIQSNELTPEKKAEIKNRMATDRAYRKALENSLKE